MPAAGKLDIEVVVRSKLDEIAATTAAMASLREATLAGVAGLKTEAQGMIATLRESTAEAKDASQAINGISKEAAGVAKVASAAKETSEKLAEANKEAEEMKSLAHQAGEEWGHFGAQLKQGLTMGFGVGFAEKAIEGVRELVGEVEKGIREGVHYNAELESLGIGLAGALRQAQPQKYLSFAAAQSDATKALATIQEKSNALGLDFKSVGEGMKTTMLALVEGGITKVNEAIEIETLLFQAAASKNVTGMQAQVDVMDLLIGRADRVALGRELGITNEDIKRAKEAGNLYGYLSEKLGAYREAAAASAQTFNGLWQSVQNLIAQLEGTVAAPIFTELKNDLAQIKQFLDSIEAKGGAQGGAIVFGGMIDGAKELLGLLQKLGPLLANLIPGLPLLANLAATLSGHPLDVGNYVAQLEANQQLVQKYQEQVAEAHTLADLERVRQAIQKDLVKSEEEYSKATGDQKTAAETLHSALQAIAYRIDDMKNGTRSAAGATGDMTANLHSANKELSELLAKLPEVVAKMQKAAEAADLADRLARAADSAQKLTILDSPLAAKLKEANEAAAPLRYSGITDSTGIRNILDSAAKGDPIVAQSGEAGAEALETLKRLYAEILPLENQRKAIERENAAELQKQADSARKYIDTTNEELALSQLRTQQTKALTRNDQDTADALAVQIRDIELMKGYKEQLAKAGTDELHATEQEKQLAMQMAQETLKQKDAQADLSNAKKDQQERDRQAHKDERSATQAQREADRQAAAERKFEDEQRENRVNLARERVSDIQNDPTRSADEKSAELSAAIAAESAALADNISYWQERNRQLQGSNAPADLQEIGQNDRKITQAQKQQTGLTRQVGVNDSGGQIKQAYVGQVNQLGTAAENAGHAFGNTLNSAIDGCSQALESLIFRTGSWKDAMASAVRSGISGLIQLGVKTLAHYALLGIQQAIFGASRSADRAKDLAETQTQAASKTAALATPTILESITSYGTAAVIGIAAVLAALAIGGGFESGGYTGGVAGQVAGVVHGGEFVISEPATRALPRDFLDALNGQQVRVASRGSRGAVSSGSVSAFASSAARDRQDAGNVSVGSPNVKVVNVSDEAAARRELLNSGEFDHAFVHHMRRHGVAGRRT